MIHYKLTMQEIVHSLKKPRFSWWLSDYKGWDLDFECIQNENKQVIKKGSLPNMYGVNPAKVITLPQTTSKLGYPATLSLRLLNNMYVSKYWNLIKHYDVQIKKRMYVYIWNSYIYIYTCICLQSNTQKMEFERPQHTLKQKRQSILNLVDPSRQCQTCMLKTSMDIVSATVFSQNTWVWILPRQDSMHINLKCCSV